MLLLVTYLLKSI